MAKTIAWRAYSKYLRDKGCSEVSQNDNPSTTYDYPARIDRICRREKFANWDELGEHIVEILEKYDANGTEAEYGNQSHGGNLRALKLFKDFYISY